MRIFSWIVLLVLIILEGTVTTLPLTLLFLLCLTVMKRQEWIFFVGVVTGVVLDLFAFRAIGISSLYFVSFIFLLLLYQRKYETATLPFVMLASFFGSMFYLLLTNEPTFLLQSVISTGIAAMAFLWYRKTMLASATDGFQHV